MKLTVISSNRDDFWRLQKQVTSIANDTIREIHADTPLQTEFTFPNQEALDALVGWLWEQCPTGDGAYRWRQSE